MSVISPKPQRAADPWLNAFSDQERRQQQSDDSMAWSRVTGLLMIVVTLGLLIAIAALIAAQMLPMP